MEPPPQPQPPPPDWSGAPQAGSVDEPVHSPFGVSCARTATGAAATIRNRARRERVRIESPPLSATEQQSESILARTAPTGRDRLERRDFNTMRDVARAGVERAPHPRR